MPWVRGVLVVGMLGQRNLLTYEAPPGNEGYDLMVAIHTDPRRVELDFAPGSEDRVGLSPRRRRAGSQYHHPAGRAGVVPAHVPRQA